LFRYFAVQNFDDFEIFNSFIMGFGQNYSNYSSENLVHFCDSLKLGGLRQDDIYSTVMQTLNEQDIETVEKHHYARMLLNMEFLQMEEQIKEWHASVAAKFEMSSDEFLLDHCDRNHQIELLHNILAKGNEGSSTVFEGLLKKLDKQQLQLNNNMRDKMKEVVALCKQKGIEFKPEFNDYTRMLQESRMSKYKKGWLKLDESLSKQGVKFEKNKNMGGKYVDYYLPEQNAALLVASPSHFCFDQTTPTSKLLML